MLLSSTRLTASLETTLILCLQSHLKKEGVRLISVTKNINEDPAGGVYRERLGHHGSVLLKELS